MKNRFIQILSIVLAAMIQIAPLMRSFLPNTQGLAPSAWAMILKIGFGTVALLGFDAVSQASNISISPANATVGTPYVGTITYSGGHAGSVSSMSYSNTCLGSSAPFYPGMTIVYAGSNQATVSGTPSATNNFIFSLRMFDRGGCGSGGNTDTRSTTLIIGPSGGGTLAPAMSAAPQNTCAQVGSTVQLSGGASGNPVPQYQWWNGLTPIAGATNSILTIPNVELTNSGVYTLTASNSQTPFAFGSLPKANCYLSVGISGGTNFSAYEFTNYAPAGMTLTMFSWVTNVATATNYYFWTYNSVNLISTSNTVPLSAAALTPAKSGTYTVTFNSTNSGGAIISGQNYDSYWAFGYPPTLTNSLPAATNVNAGANVTLSIAIGGTLNVYNGAGGAGSYVTNNITPCIFWYQNGNLVASQNYVLGPTSLATYSNTAVHAALNLSSVTSANAGSYIVVASNFWGSVTSTPAALSVSDSTFAPTITTNPPAAISLLAGQNSAISVTVTGTPPFSFQWRKDGANLADGGVYGGVLTNTLLLTSVHTTNGGNYTVAITNNGGAITSSVAAVNIALPPTVNASSPAPGTVQFGGITVTGLTYVVEMATNLAGASWTPLQTNNTGVSGTINFQTNTSSAPNIFYRLFFP